MLPQGWALWNDQGICAALLTQDQQGMDLPWAKLGEARPADPKAGVLLYWAQKKPGCYPEGAAGEAFGYTKVWHIPKQPQVPAVGGTGTVGMLGPKPRPSTAAVANALTPWDADRS